MRTTPHHTLRTVLDKHTEPTTQRAQTRTHTHTQTLT